MNRPDDKRQESPDAVGAAYRAMATERAPEHLDREVLRRANHARKTASAGNWFSNRIRPLAFVVTAGLSLALLIQLSNTPLIEIPPGDPESESQSDNVFQDAARQTAEQIRQLDTGADTSMAVPDVDMNPVQATERPAGLSLLPVEDRCTDSDRAESGTWWQCIRKLEKRGLSESAELELQALLKAHPRFAAPQ